MNIPTKVRRGVMVAMAALMVAGAGGLASQAGFQDTADVVATGKAGTVVVNANGSSSTPVNFGTNLKGGSSTAVDVTINYTGSLAANVSYATSSTATGKDKIRVQYSTDGGTTWIPSTATTAPLISAFDLPNKAFSGAGSQAYKIRLYVPDDAQGLTGDMTITATANQS